ncbi:TolC family protein [Christiangramia sabulilitoris]|uniref:TolC family protein n=1 Tax=Christiangramia sabulilitoris TaxID=2583991 RepID=A0A550I7W7_9FLAO|nr:TolC family protein [Christiangramia sabulilitoris]TRO67059.1 TolC family protein [Christiangramia sabulilitoris]
MKTLKIYIQKGLFLFCLFLTGGIIKAQQIEDYLRLASENNPEVKAAYSNFEAALQKAPQVSALPDPTLTVSAFGQMMETRLGSQEARFTLMQMFPWFGKLEAEKSTALLMAEAKFQKYLLTQQNLFLKVKSAYAEMYAVSEEIKLKQKNLEILESYRKLALNRFESGSAPMVNVVKVDINREEAIIGIELMQEELKTLKRQFNYLLNRNADAEVVIQDNLELVNIPELLVTAENASFEDHPEAGMLEKEKLAFENEQLVAKKMGMPMIGLGVDYTIIARRTDANPADNGMDAIMPMLSVSLPIFRKKYNARIKESKLMAQASVQQKEAVINDLKSEFEMASYNLKKSKRLIELYDKQIESSGQANKLLISGFSNASSDFEEVLQMNQDILMFQTEKINALANAYKAAAKLQFLLFKNNTDENE